MEALQDAVYLALLVDDPLRQLAQWPHSRAHELLSCLLKLIKFRLDVFPLGLGVLEVVLDLLCELRVLLAGHGRMAHGIDFVQLFHDVVDLGVLVLEGGGVFLHGCLQLLEACLALIDGYILVGVLLLDAGNRLILDLIESLIDLLCKLDAFFDRVSNRLALILQGHTFLYKICMFLLIF